MGKVPKRCQVTRITTLRYPFLWPVCIVGNAALFCCFLLQSEIPEKSPPVKHRNRVDVFIFVSFAAVLGLAANSCTVSCGKREMIRTVPRNAFAWTHSSVEPEKLLKVWKATVVNRAVRSFVFFASLGYGLPSKVCCGKRTIYCVDNIGLPVVWLCDLLCVVLGWRVI